MGARTERDPKLAGTMTDLEAEHHKISALARQFREAVQNVLQEVEVSRSAFDGSMSSSVAGALRVLIEGWNGDEVVGRLGQGFTGTDGCGGDACGTVPMVDAKEGGVRIDDVVHCKIARKRPVSHRTRSYD